ncbi:hypothetical protein B0T16DRAFT_329152 [Cercophora newfieldiana]|uniref:DUF1993 domain-containing protein n=1 Tax=Cercophora newfieldiana TaxID=92897 RepID=A0AA40CQ04_9PEZI|nr:hypothetical protein B0T16DRAFT_329152 [Cercophora newfieldiana]
MPISLHTASVDIFVKSLLTLKRILKKAQSHPDSASFPSARLYEDMHPLSFQIQAVSTRSVAFVERLLPEKGPAPTWEDNESTIEELLDRVDKTLEWLGRVEEKDFKNGEEDRVMELPMSATESIALEVKGYALGWTVPHVFFHVSMAYAILRHKGVSLGKKDFTSEFIEPIVLEVREKSA